MDGADVFIQVKAVELFEECADAGLLPLVRTQQPALQQWNGSTAAGIEWYANRSRHQYTQHLVAAE